jgi:tetratricopeptide (TPR) repeat protein
MTEGPSDRVEVLFYQAADLPPHEQRDLLDAACHDDPGLRAAVEGLLARDARQRAEEGAATFLESPLERPSTPPLTAARPGLPARVGRYRVLRLLGEGGMGTVYEAEQDSPRRAVALKVIRPGLVAPPLLRRFAQEAQILGRLHHPGIAQIYDAGLAEDGQPFFALELVRGEPLDEHAHRQSLDAAGRLELLARVCDAVQHAHEQGVVHRDLKPGNVLVDEAGQPKVLDFGVARATDADLLTSTAHTRTGQLVGTPSYMSPEQVAADPAAVDRRSDVYTLGVILYELLTGRLPYPLQHLPLPEVAWVIREQEPVRLGALDRRLRGDVETIVAKALEKDRARRYQSAAELAADVRRHLSNEPIKARPPSALYQLRKFARRHKALVATTAVFLGLLLGGGAVTAWQEVRLAHAERDQALEQARRGQEAREALVRAEVLREQARAERDSRKWAQAREQAERALALAEGGPTAEELVAQVKRVRGELDEEQKDRRLVADIEAARLVQAETLTGEGRFASERAIPRFQEAFRAYGLPVGQGDPAAAAARLRRRPAEVRQAVNAALDDWLDLAARPQNRASEPHLDWLRALVAAELDEGGLREIRAACQEQDPGKRRVALERLAAAPDVHQLPPDTLTRLARRLVDAQSPSSAVQLLRRAWRQYPADFWVSHDLGETLTMTEPLRWAEAVRYLTAAVALRPDSPGVHNNLGRALQEGKQFDEAIACFQKAIALDPKLAGPHSNLGLVLKGKGRVDEAIACYRQAIALDPKFALPHTNLGNALQDKGRLDEAIASHRRAVALDPKSVLANNNLGNALYRKGQFDEAVASLREALAIDPNYAPAHTNLGLVHAARGRLDEAIACFQNAVEVDPKYFQAHYNLGIALQRKGRLDEAVACFRQAISINPKYAPVHAQLGLALWGMGKPDEAVACLRQTISIDPKDASAHYNLGNALYRKGRPDEAVACFRQAISLDPKYAPAHYSLGSALQATGRPDEALACFRRAVEIAPKDAIAHTNLGIALVDKGRPDEGIACLRRAISLDPKHTPAHYNLGSALQATGRLDEAVACYRQAVALAPNYVMAHYNLGHALQATGRLDEAVACYRRAVELDPKYAEAHCNLGQVLLRQGDLRAALAALRTGHDLGSRRKDWRYDSAQWVKRCERFLELEGRLPAILKGEDRPDGAAARLELAELCQYKRLHATSVRFVTEAFAADAKLADDLLADHRYRAACSAALAAAGQGEDATSVPDKARASLRKQALQWLRANLAGWARRLKDGTPRERTQAQAVLRTWQSDPALAGVRDAGPLAALPSEERAGWQRLWDDVAALAAKARDAK